MAWADLTEQQKQNRRNTVKRWYNRQKAADPSFLARNNAYLAKRHRERIASDPEYRRVKHENDRRNRKGSIEGWAKNQLRAIRVRASKIGVPFDLTVDDLLKAFPADGLCPVLRKPFVFGRNSGHDPMNISVDRLIPSLGYVASNIRIISREVNLMKRRCVDPDVFFAIGEWLLTELASCVQT